jgi:hypothetical protein
MRHILIFLFCISSWAVCAQGFDFMVGPNISRFRGHEDRSGETYVSGSGISAGIGYDLKKGDRTKLRLAFLFDFYQGSLSASNGTLAGGWVADAAVQKSTVGLAVYPFNRRLFKVLDLNLGLMWSALLSDLNTGSSSFSVFGIPPTNHNLSDPAVRFNKTGYLGLVSRVAYQTQISPKLDLNAQINSYFGLGNEFIIFPKYTKSMRCSVGLGLKYKFIRK